MSTEPWKFDGFRVSAMKARGTNKDGQHYWRAVTRAKPYCFVWSGWAHRDDESVKAQIVQAWESNAVAQKAVAQEQQRNESTRVRAIRRAIAELVRDMDEATMVKTYGAVLKLANAR